MASGLVLDWDQDQFHLLSVQTSRRGVQVVRAVTWTHPQPFTPSTADRIGKALREFIKTEKIAVAPVIVGIGRDRIHLKELRVPPIAAHEEAALVRFQTAKEMTEGIDNYAIDYTHLSPPARDTDRQIMTVAARRDQVLMIQTLCQSAGLKLQAITPRLFGVPAALARAVLPEATPMTANKRNVVLALGQRWAELSFYRGERLIQAQALAKGTLLVSEIKRNLAVFQAQHAVEIEVSGPECLYVFGDDAAVIQSLQAGLSLPIVPLDPVGQDVTAAAPTKNPGPFAGALGLALLWSQTKTRPVNLAVPRKQQAPVSVTRQRGMIYGAVGGLAAVFLIGIMVYVISTKKAEVRRLAESKEESEKFLKDRAQERADIEGYKDWEQTTIPWLDEMYDLTARYPNELGLRVNQFSATTTTKKNAKDGFVGRISLNGIAAPGKQGTAAIDRLHSALSRDIHLRASIVKIHASATGTSPQEYQMKIDVAKQPAAKYDTRLVLPPLLVAPEPVAAAQDDEEGVEP